jgi:DNA-binding MarR family transcriptional regulator
MSRNRYFAYPADPSLRPLVAASSVMSVFQGLNRSMSMEAAQVFLMVAMVGGKTPKYYACLSGVSQPTMSRILTDLSVYRRTRAGAPEAREFGRTQGYGLVTLAENPDERREKLVHLTPHGRELAEQIKRIVRGQE